MDTRYLFIRDMTEFVIFGEYGYLSFCNFFVFLYVFVVADYVSDDILARQCHFGHLIQALLNSEKLSAKRLLAKRIFSTYLA